MSLFPEENILTKEIESWRVLADGLKSEEDKKLFLEMLEKCQKYSVAINAKGKPFSNGTFDYGPFIRTARNDKLVRKYGKYGIQTILVLHIRPKLFLYLSFSSIREIKSAIRN